MRSKSFVVGVIAAWLVGCWGSCLSHAAAEAHFTEKTVACESHEDTDHSIPCDDAPCHITANPGSAASIQLVSTSQTVGLPMLLFSSPDQPRWEARADSAPPRQADPLASSHLNKAPPALL